MWCRFFGGGRKKFVGHCYSVMDDYESTIQFSSFEYETIYKFGGGGEVGRGGIPGPPSSV